MFQSLESGIEEFEPSSDAWKRKWRSSNQVPKPVFGNGGVRTKFRSQYSELVKIETGYEA